MIKFYSLSIKSEQKKSTKNLNENKNGNAEEGRKRMLFFCFVVIKWKWWKSTLYEDDEGRKEIHDEKRKRILKCKTRHYYYDRSNSFDLFPLRYKYLVLKWTFLVKNKQTEIRLQQSNIKTQKNCIILKQSKTKIKNLIKLNI